MTVEFIMNLDTKLFFKINNLARCNKWLDLFGYAGSEWALPLMAVYYAAMVLAMSWENKMIGFLILIFSAGLWLTGFVLDFCIALIVKRSRPHVTHPNSNLLIKPIANWHSFPSDHTMTAFLICWLALIFGLPWAWVFFPFAVWVVFGRMFVGVHYPTDILGGLTIASLLAGLLQYILKMSLL